MEGLYPHQTSFSVMLKIALVGYMLQLPLFLLRIYGLTSYVITCITHFQQMFDSPFRYTIMFVCVSSGCCFTMSFSLQNVFKFLKLYSPLPSHSVALIFFLV